MPCIQNNVIEIKPDYMRCKGLLGKGLDKFVVLDKLTSHE